MPHACPKCGLVHSAPDAPDPTAKNVALRELRRRLPEMKRLLYPQLPPDERWPILAAGKRWQREDEMLAYIIDVTVGRDPVKTFADKPPAYLERLRQDLLDKTAPGSRNHAVGEFGIDYIERGEREQMLHFLRDDRLHHGIFESREEQGSIYETITSSVVAAVRVVAIQRGDAEMVNECSAYLGRERHFLERCEWVGGDGRTYTPGQRHHLNAVETPSKVRTDQLAASRGAKVNTAKLSTRPGEIMAGGQPTDLVLWMLAAAQAEGVGSIASQEATLKYPMLVERDSKGILVWIVPPMTDSLVAIGAGDRVEHPDNKGVERWIVPYKAAPMQFKRATKELEPV